MGNKKDFFESILGHSYPPMDKYQTTSNQEIIDFLQEKIPEYSWIIVEYFFDNPITHKELAKKHDTTVQKIRGDIQKALRILRTPDYVQIIKDRFLDMNTWEKDKEMDEQIENNLKEISMYVKEKNK